MQTVMKQDGKGSTKNHQKIKRESEEDTIHLSQRVLQILNWNHQTPIAILTHLYPHHLMIVLQVMRGVGEERDLPKETNTDVEKERTDGVTKNAGGEIRNQGANQEGYIHNAHP